MQDDFKKKSNGFRPPPYQRLGNIFPKVSCSQTNHPKAKLDRLLIMVINLHLQQELVVDTKACTFAKNIHEEVKFF